MATHDEGLVWSAQKGVRSRRFSRSSGSAQAPIPEGALLVARRLIDEGHSREAVRAALAENFRRLDVEATVEAAFDGIPDVRE